MPALPPGRNNPAGQQEQGSRPVRVVNIDTEDVPPFGAMELAGWDIDARAFRVHRCTLTGRSDLIFNGLHPIPAGMEGQARGDVHVTAAFIPSEGDNPHPGEIWGVKAGEWLLRRSVTGYSVLDTTTASRGFCVVQSMRSVLNEHIRVLGTPLETAGIPTNFRDARLLTFDAESNAWVDTPTIPVWYRASDGLAVTDFDVYADADLPCQLVGYAYGRPLYAGVMDRECIRVFDTIYYDELLTLQANLVVGNHYWRDGPTGTPEFGSYPPGLEFLLPVAGRYLITGKMEFDGAAYGPLEDQFLPFLAARLFDVTAQSVVPNTEIYASFRPGDAVYSLYPNVQVETRSFAITYHSYYNNARLKWQVYRSQPPASSGFIPSWRWSHSTFAQYESLGTTHVSYELLCLDPNGSDAGSGSGSGSGDCEENPLFTGAGIYCVYDPDSNTCIVLELLESDRCDTSIGICSGPYADRRTALLYCSGDGSGSGSGDAVGCENYSVDGIAHLTARTSGLSWESSEWTITTTGGGGWAVTSTTGADSGQIWVADSWDGTGCRDFVRTNVPGVGVMVRRVCCEGSEGSGSGDGSGFFWFWHCDGRFYYFDGGTGDCANNSPPSDPGCAGWPTGHARYDCHTGIWVYF